MSSSAVTPATTPATPRTPTAQRSEAATPTGAWRHPKFAEITRRQHATTFDERNVKIIVANLAFLLLSFVAISVSSRVAVLRTVANPLLGLIHSLPYHSLLVLAIRLVLVLNIGTALLPLARRYTPDDIADIPLTPSQRQSMGLDPSVRTPQTPGSAYQSPNYVTPPRYQKSTPRSSFSAAGDRTAQSPLSGSPRASLAHSTSNSPFSPSAGSPLLQKAVAGGSATRRLSYNSRGSPLTNSFFGESSSSNAPSTPTPSMGKASVGLNNKWLYEKRRDSPRSSLFS
ncbi:nuclear pore complex component-domain-containing protein [Massariosphaeria phaeospora]|uniref:Nuclear pore complex component-domain-containing protein n=1 Tax=Massariosphaeria phaeospora TaxID=100035 RepID=A0A7C8M7H8_9PLEO|nr:nuclear pore complex component-domain-containing protein [Massariosphaeria phaeospora]